jgi:hypothetical protein
VYSQRRKLRRENLEFHKQFPERGQEGEAFRALFKEISSSSEKKNEVELVGKNSPFTEKRTSLGDEPKKTPAVFVERRGSMEEPVEKRSEEKKRKKEKEVKEAVFHKRRGSMDSFSDGNFFFDFLRFVFFFQFFFFIKLICGVSHFFFSPDDSS